MRTIRIASLVLLALAATGCSRGVKRENAQLKDQNSTLSSQFAECQTTREQMQSKLDATTMNLTQANARVKDLSAQLDAAKRSASASQARFNESYRSLVALQARADQDSKALSQANDQVASLRAAIEQSVSGAAAANEKANAQIAELSRQIAALQAKSAEQARGTVSTSRPGKSSASAGDK